MRTVCVTGATGFIAAHLVADLLAAGHRVRGTVRSTAPEKVAHLRALPGADERLELAIADLRDASAFPDVVDGCEVVMHTASPYALDVEDPQRDLVEPAVEGTRNVLSACAGVDGVQRVVLTSSMAAVTDEPDGRVLTEEDWNERSSLERNPYYYSKTLAERAAWQFMGEAERVFDLVVINPFMVIGPSLSPSLNTSNGLLVSVLKREYPGILDLTWGLVDVRDVARAHVLAMDTPSASGRYLCACCTLSMRELIGLLRAQGHQQLPWLPLDSGLATMLVRLGAGLQTAGVASYLRTHLGRVPRFDHGKIVRELGLDFRPIDETVRETVVDLERWGHLPPSD